MYESNLLYRGLESISSWMDGYTVSNGWLIASYVLSTFLLIVIRAAGQAKAFDKGWNEAASYWTCHFNKQKQEAEKVELSKLLESERKLMNAAAHDIGQQIKGFAEKSKSEGFTAGATWKANCITEYLLRKNLLQYNLNKKTGTKELVWNFDSYVDQIWNGSTYDEILRVQDVQDALEKALMKAIDGTTFVQDRKVVDEENQLTYPYKDAGCDSPVEESVNQYVRRFGEQGQLKPINASLNRVVVNGRGGV